MENKKVAIIYAYYETNKSKGNLNYFLKNGGYLESDNVDYFFLVNGKTCTADIPKDNKNVFRFLRPNEGHGWGGWRIVLEERDMSKYDYFILMKDYMIGPFIYSWMKDKVKWIKVFLNLLNDKVKLVGPTINIQTKKIGKKWRFIPHVQACMLVTDKVGIKIVREIANKKTAKKREVILSNEMLIRGYQIKSLQQAYQNVDFEKILKYSPIEIDDKIKKILPNLKYKGDVYNDLGYFNTQINPYEVIFYKRKNDTPELDLAIRSNLNKIKF